MKVNTIFWFLFIKLTWGQSDSTTFPLCITQSVNKQN